jgi:hypothetical protein
MSNTSAALIITQALSAALICPPWADAVPIRRIDNNSHPVRIYITNHWDKNEKHHKII